MWFNIKFLITIFVPVAIGLVSAIKLNAPLAGIVFGLPCAMFLLLIFFWREI